MKIAVIVLAGVAAAAAIAAGVFATLYFTDDSDEPTAAVAASCGDRMYGHIASLKPDGDEYRMRFDPAWFTSGVTANVAAAEDGKVEPGEPVPNDNYVVDEGHRLLTYIVPTDTPVTVLTRQGDPANFGATFAISAIQTSSSPRSPCVLASSIVIPSMSVTACGESLTTSIEPPSERSSGLISGSSKSSFFTLF